MVDQRAAEASYGVPDAGLTPSVGRHIADVGVGELRTCEQYGLSLDRDLNAARDLAHLVDEVASGVSSPSCGATRNEPDGNPHQTRTTRAAGTATGRPDPQGWANAATARRRLPEKSKLTPAHTSGNGESNPP